MNVAIDGITQFSQSAQAQASPASQGSAELGQETFLQLLTTQLQNQDPLNPQSNEEFVAQLAQFSSLEQLVGLNSSVDSLYMATASMNNATMTQLLGREVSAWSDQFHYGGSGDATIHFDSEADAAAAELTITDADGSVVWSGPMGALEEGEGSFTWDGRDQSGNVVDEGIYTFSIDAQDSNGEDVVVSGQIYGEIDGMSYADGTPVPSISGVEIALGEIIRVETAGGDADGGESDDEDDSGRAGRLSKKYEMENR